MEYNLFITWFLYYGTLLHINGLVQDTVQTKWSHCSLALSHQHSIKVILQDLHQIMKSQMAVDTLPSHASYGPYFMNALEKN